MSPNSDIRPLHDDDDHAWALGELEKVLGAAPDTPEGNRFELLAILIDAYEAKHHAIPPPTPEQARAFAVEQGREADQEDEGGAVIRFTDYLPSSWATEPTITYSIQPRPRTRPHPRRQARG